MKKLLKKNPDKSGINVLKKGLIFLVVLAFSISLYPRGIERAKTDCKVIKQTGNFAGIPDYYENENRILIDKTQSNPPPLPNYVQIFSSGNILNVNLTFKDSKETATL